MRMASLATATLAMGLLVGSPIALTGCSDDNDLGDAVHDAAEDVKDAAGDVKDNVKDAAEDVKDEINKD